MQIRRTYFSLFITKTRIYRIIWSELDNCSLLNFLIWKDFCFGNLFVAKADINMDILKIYFSIKMISLKQAYRTFFWGFAI